MNTDTFRAAHAYLRGYSDALAGRGYNESTWPNHAAHYSRGFTAGDKVRAAAQGLAAA